MGRESSTAGLGGPAVKFEEHRQKSVEEGISTRRKTRSEWQKGKGLKSLGPAKESSKTGGSFFVSSPVPDSCTLDRGGEDGEKKLSKQKDKTYI